MKTDPPPPPAPRSDVVEIPLPSGTFARIRRVTIFDRFYALTYSGGLTDDERRAHDPEGEDASPGAVFLGALMSRVVRFDDERLDAKQILAMDGRDLEALLTHLNPFIIGPIR